MWVEDSQNIHSRPKRLALEWYIHMLWLALTAHSHVDGGACPNKLIHNCMPAFIKGT